MSRRYGGYSLYELLVTLAVASTLIFIGVPSFAKLAARQAQAAELNALFHAVHEARKESVTLRRVVSLCPSLRGTACDGAWSDGWMIFVNSDRDWPAVRDAGEPVVRWHHVNPAVTIQANRRSFSLRSTDLRATNGTLIICDSAARIQARALVVSYTGRPRTALEKRDGSPYRCAH